MLNILKALARVVSMASVTGPDIHRLKHVFVDLLGRGHWSKAALLIRIVLASLSNITNFTIVSSRKKRHFPPLFPTPVVFKTLCLFLLLVWPNLKLFVVGAIGVNIQKNK